MPMAVVAPAFRHGKLTRVMLAQKDASLFLNSAEVSISAETHETSAFGTVAKSFIPGKRDATISIGGMYDGTVGQLDELMTSLHGTEATYPLTLFYDAGIAVGRVCRLASVYQTSYDTSSPATDIVSVSGEMQTNDGVRFGYVLNGETPVLAATITGTAIDCGASSATVLGGTMHVHVPANTRSTAVTVKTQVSTDNSVWTDLLTQNVPAATVAGYSVTVPTGTVARYIRALITPTAGTGSAVIIVAFGRN